MTKNNFVVGFMLFAIFFGAGNLIFPPKLGLESGGHFLPAILGFITTGVGLPLLGIIVSACYEGGYTSALNRIHPWFSLIFLAAIYLSIGPFFAGPRTGATAYEMAVLPFLKEPSSISLFIFTLIYFSLTLWLSLNPSKMVDRIGAILTPVLIISIIGLVIRAFFLLNTETIHPAVSEDSWLFKGVIEGYFTMDALASLAFSVIVLNAIKAKGVSPSALIKQTVVAGVIAASALGVIYFSLGWIGNHIEISQDTLATLEANKQDLGTYILNTITIQAFGEYGRMVLGIIVSLACLTTAVGLCASVSEYFNEVFPKISYRTYVIIFCLLSMLIANLGLKEVITRSIPVLLILYPIAMTVILMLGINALHHIPLLGQRLAVGLVTIISILSVIGTGFTDQLPFKSYSMEWMPFAIIGLVTGYIIHHLIKKR